MDCPLSTYKKNQKDVRNPPFVDHLLLPHGFSTSLSMFATMLPPPPPWGSLSGTFCGRRLTFCGENDGEDLGVPVPFGHLKGKLRPTIKFRGT